jgi:hypothetical protein
MDNPTPVGRAHGIYAGMILDDVEGGYAESPVGSGRQTVNHIRS